MTARDCASWSSCWQWRTKIGLEREEEGVRVRFERGGEGEVWDWVIEFVCCMLSMDHSHPWTIRLSMDDYVTHGGVVYISWTKFHE